MTISQMKKQTVEKIKSTKSFNQMIEYSNDAITGFRHNSSQDPKEFARGINKAIANQYSKDQKVTLTVEVSFGDDKDIILYYRDMSIKEIKEDISGNSTIFKNRPTSIKLLDELGQYIIKELEVKYG